MIWKIKKNIKVQRCSENICNHCLIHAMMDKNERSQDDGEQTYQNLISGRQQ